MYNNIILYVQFHASLVCANRVCTPYTQHNIYYSFVIHVIICLYIIYFSILYNMGKRTVDSTVHEADEDGSASFSFFFSDNNNIILPILYFYFRHI